MATPSQRPLPLYKYIFKWSLRTNDLQAFLVTGCGGPCSSIPLSVEMVFSACPAVSAVTSNIHPYFLLFLYQPDSNMQLKLSNLGCYELSMLARETSHLVGNITYIKKLKFKSEDSASLLGFTRTVLEGCCLGNSSRLDYSFLIFFNVFRNLWRC